MTGSSPWPARSVAVLAGLALYAAHPPAGIRMLAFAVPALLVVSVELLPADRGRAWTCGALAYGLGHALLLVWLVPAAGFVPWVLLSLIQAAWGAGLGAAIGAARRVRVAAPLLVAVAWVGVDAWRATLPLGGFAWGTLGAAQVGDAWLRPLARLAGEDAMTLVVALLGAAAGYALSAVLRAARSSDGGLDAQRLRAALPAGRTGAAWLAGGAVVATLATVEPPPSVGELDVLSIQPWDQEDVLGSRAYDRQVAAQALDLTRQAIGDGGGVVPDLTIWPESTVNHDPATDPELAQTLSAGGAVTDGGLLAGVKLDGPDADETWFNTATVVGADGSLGQQYRKLRPVPFGEYVPFRDLLDWFPALEQVPRDMVRGDGPSQVTVADVPIAVAICFESLFPAVVADNVLADPDPAQLVVVSTYDGSFGRVGEAAQHVDQSRLRALETGRWVVHSGSSGLTAFISPSGEVHDVTELFTSAYRRRSVPLVQGLTPYLRTGNWVGQVARAAIALAAAAGLVRAGQRRRTERRGDTLDSPLEQQ